MKAIVKKLGIGIAGAAAVLMGLGAFGVDLVPMDKLWVALPVSAAGVVALMGIVSKN